MTYLADEFAIKPLKSTRGRVSVVNEPKVLYQLEWNSINRNLTNICRGHNGSLFGIINAQ